MGKAFYLEVNESKEKALIVEEDIQKFLNSKEQEIVRNPSKADIIISLGGDGTFIQTANKYRYLNLPLFGINCGTLGYLTEGTINNYKEKLLKIINDEYIEENRMILKGKVKKGNKLLEYEALNDIVITKKRFETIRLNVYVNNEFLTNYVADGLICSTPTGSTGYALSVGGAIIDPCSKMLEIIPIAAHTLLNRGIVLSENNEVIIKLNKERQVNEAQVIFDGNNVLNFNKEDELVIAISNNFTKVIKVDKESFVEMLSKKMRI